MSYNPVRAKNFYRNTSKRRRKSSPKDGTKHSDIIRRAGVTSISLTGRVNTAHGFSAPIFDCKKYSVRSELLAAGNSTGFGVNPKGERTYIVTRGVLYVFCDVESEDEDREILKIQPGGSFSAPRGTKYGVAASGTDGVELTIVETTKYAETWEQLEDSTSRQLSSEDAILAPKAVAKKMSETPRRKDQTKAKAAALAVARSRVRSRRNPKKAAPAKTSTASAEGNAVKIGPNVSGNANSSNVVGVNPRPMRPQGD